MKEESELTSQQIETCNLNISRLSKEVEALSHSLQEKQATVSLLERKLQSHKQAAEHQKQQAEMVIKEMEALKKLQIERHAKLGTCKLFF